MRLNMQIKKTIIKEIARRYQKVKKKDKAKILNEFMNLTGYCRGMLHGFLRNCERKVIMRCKKRGKSYFCWGDCKSEKEKKKSL